MKFQMTLFAVLISVFSLQNSFAATNEVLGKKLALILLTAREVVTKDHPKLINDPTSEKADVGDTVLSETRQLYPAKSGESLDESDDATYHLMSAIKHVVTSAQQGTFKDKWKDKPFAGKFLPARFAREVADYFNQSTKDKETGKEKYKLRLTTIDDFLIEKTNEADPWERNALSKYLNGDLKPYETYFSKGENYDGRSGFRLIKTEYFGSKCLTCHGGENGAKYHKSHKAGKINDLGGAVSVVIFN